VLKICLLPANSGLQMASLTIRIEFGQSMIGILRRANVRLMAIPAIHRSAGKVLALVFRMTCIAIDQLMHAVKRKSSCLMQAEDVFLGTPIGRRMTAFAFAAQLIMMDVVVAVNAGNADIGEA